MHLLGSLLSFVAHIKPRPDDDTDVSEVTGAKFLSQHTFNTAQ